MSSAPLLPRELSVPVLVGGGIAVGVIMMGVIALLMGGLSLPGETAATHQPAVEIYSSRGTNPGQAKTQPAAVSELAATGTQKRNKDQQAKPERAVETVAVPERLAVEVEIVAASDESSAGSGSSTGAGAAYASGFGSGGGASSGGGYGSPSAGGGFQVSGGSGFGFGGGLNQSPRGSPAVLAAAPGAPANPPQAGLASIPSLAGPAPTPTPDAPASSPNLSGPAPAPTPTPVPLSSGPPLPGPAPLPQQAGPPLPGPAPLPQQAGPPPAVPQAAPSSPAVPIPTPDQIITAALPSDGVLRPGHSPGTEILPNLNAYNAIEIEIAGPDDGQFDVVILTDPVATFPAGFKISFILLDSYVPGSGKDFEFLFTNAAEGEENISYLFDPGSSLLPAGFVYQVYIDKEADFHVRFFDANSPPQGYVHDLYTGAVEDDNGVIVAVPEPSTTALGLLGLALLGWRMRRPVATPKH